MNPYKLFFCIDSLHNGGAERLLVDYLNMLDGKFDVTLLVLYGYGVYFDLLPQDVKCIVLPKASLDDLLYIETGNFDLEIAFLEGAAAYYISHRNNSSMKIAWIHTNIGKNNWCNKFF